MIQRVIVVTALFVATGLAASRAGSADAAVARHPLAELPLELGDWHGREARPFDDDVVNQLGVDDYIHRAYFETDASAVGLYVGYYASQQQGDTMHSPQNCLPGAGWHPIESGYLDVTSGAAAVRINRYVIQKAVDRQVVLYWYQGRGRIVANEYTNKAFLMWDAMRLHRTSGGLVRVIAPVVTTAPQATTMAARFVSALLPHLPDHLP